MADGLTAWAEQEPGVLAVLTGWLRGAAGDTLALGVVVNGDADADTVGSGVTDVVRSSGRPSRVRVEVWAPSRGLEAEALRRYRASTRCWTRHASRSGSAGATAPPLSGRSPAAMPAAMPASPVLSSVEPSRPVETDTPAEDVVLDGGFTLAGIDLDSPLEPGPVEPDDRDAALVAWARTQSHAVALLRGTSTTADREKIQFPVYCLVTATQPASAAGAGDGAGAGADSDPELQRLRRALAAAIAATGASRAAAEAFMPTGSVSAFHLGLVSNTRVLWRRPARSAD